MQFRERLKELFVFSPGADGYANRVRKSHPAHGAHNHAVLHQVSRERVSVKFEINEIRGVNVGGVIKTLLEKHLITTAGRKPVIGRPILYRTSRQFLMRFGLSDLEELPSLKEFEQLAQAALGSDEGVAPIEPDDARAPSGEAAASATSAGESAPPTASGKSASEDSETARAASAGATSSDQS